MSSCFHMHGMLHVPTDEVTTWMPTKGLMYELLLQSLNVLLKLQPLTFDCPHHKL
jgi:hypothetical protein